MRRRLVLFLVLLAVLAGCVSRGPTAPDPIVIAHIAPRGAHLHNGMVQPARLVIRDAATFSETWRHAFADAPMPVVDFTREMVIVAAMGAQPTGGNGIKVTHVGESEGRVHVRVTMQTPGRHCVVTQVTTTPVDFALVSLVRGSVEFRDRTLTTECGGN